MLICFSSLVTYSRRTSVALQPQPMLSSPIRDHPLYSLFLLLLLFEASHFPAQFLEYFFTLSLDCLQNKQRNQFILKILLTGGFQELPTSWDSQGLHLWWLQFCWNLIQNLGTRGRSVSTVEWLDCAQKFQRERLAKHDFHFACKHSCVFNFKMTKVELAICHGDQGKHSIEMHVLIHFGDLIPA